MLASLVELKRSDLATVGGNVAISEISDTISFVRNLSMGTSKTSAEVARSSAFFQNCCTRAEVWCSYKDGETETTIFGREALLAMLVNIQEMVLSGHGRDEVLKLTQPFKTFKWLLTDKEQYQVGSVIKTVSSTDYAVKAITDIGKKGDIPIADGAQVRPVLVSTAASSSSSSCVALAPASSVSPFKKPKKMPQGPKSAKAASADAKSSITQSTMMAYFVGKGKRRVGEGREILHDPASCA